MTTSDFRDVGDFHQKFGLPFVPDPGEAYPNEVSPELLEFRINFLREELQEFEEGAAAGDHAKMFDSLIDLNYISLGTAHLQGYPWEIGWMLVQQANMSKVRSKSRRKDSGRGSSFDVIKPPGWVAPDIHRLLEIHGWNV